MLVVLANADDPRAADANVLARAIADARAHATPADANVNAYAPAAVFANADAGTEHGSGRRMSAREPYGHVRYADPGYQADSVKRYPLEIRKGTLSPRRVRNAWARIHQNQFRYTGRELRLIEGRIRGAARRLGIHLIEHGH